ncbi:MAG TPA: extracellular solute-binding protein, partial [Candidatus Limnocylindria bacterium]|nr:extracellular solute-binding protein [Candidatus Limnocylindria bacterium]
LGVAFYPKVNEAASFGATVSGSSLVMFDHGSDARKAAARELVKYLTGAAVQADFAAGTGYAPSNKGAAGEQAYRDLLAKFPQHSVALEQLAVTPAAMRSVTVGPARDFYYAIQDTVSAMLDEGLSVEETVELMEEELNGLLFQFNQAN